MFPRPEKDTNSVNSVDIVDAPSNSSQDIPAHFPDNFSIQGESINISPRRDDFPNPPSSLDIHSPNSIISLSQTINTLDIFPDKVKSPSSSSSIKETPHLASKTAEVSPQARNDDKVFPQASNDDTIVPGEEMYPGEDRTVSLSPAPHQILLASAFMDDARNGHHMEFEPTVSAVNLYNRYKSWYMQWIMYFTLLLYLALVLVEEPAVPGIHVQFYISMAVEVLCLAFFLFRLGHEYWFSSKTRFWRDEKHIVLVVLIFASVLDICIYCALAGFNITSIRVSRPFRPFFLVNIPEGRQIRRAFRNIRRTLPEILSVLVLFLLIIAVFALMACKIFGHRGWEKTTGGPYFDNYLDSYWDLYILVTTANNPDIMMPAYDQNPWLSLFFIIFIIICVYIFMSIFLAVVYNNYRSNLKNEIHEALRRKRELLKTVFDLMKSKENGKEVIREQDFAKLIQLTLPRKSQQYTKMVWCVLDADNNGYLDQKEFLSVADLLNIPVTEVLPNLFERHIPNIYQSSSSTILKTVVRHKWFRYIFDTIIIINAFFILFDMPDGYEFGFLTVFIIEILLKIYTFGFYMFSRKLWNVFDVIVIGLAFIISIIEVIRGDEFDSRLILDIMLVLRVLRIVKIFHSLGRFRTILNTIMHILPSMLTYAGVLFVFFYFFAVIGLEAFKGSIEFYGPDDSSLEIDQLNCGNINLENSEFVRQKYCGNNFNNILRAFVVLFELLVVNQWHVIANGYELAVGSRFTRIYFICFHLLSVIIVLNIFTAFVLEVFIHEYSFTKGRLESSLEVKINEMGLGLGSRPIQNNQHKPDDLARQSIIEDDQLANDEIDADHDNLQFVCKQLEGLSARYTDYSADTAVRFHLNKGARNVHTMLEKLFLNELNGNDLNDERENVFLSS